MRHPLVIETKGHPFDGSVRGRLEVDEQTLLRDCIEVSSAVAAHTPKPRAADARRRICPESFSDLIDGQGRLGAQLAIHALAKCDGPSLPALITTWHLFTAPWVKTARLVALAAVQ